MQILSEECELSAVALDLLGLEVADEGFGFGRGYGHESMMVGKGDGANFRCLKPAFLA